MKWTSAHKCSSERAGRLRSPKNTSYIDHSEILWKNSILCFYFDVVVQLQVRSIKPGTVTGMFGPEGLFVSFFSIHMLNHIILFCWKVSIVTHAQCLIGYGLHLQRPWTQNNALFGTSSTLVGSEWVGAGHPPKAECVFLSRRTCCDISPGDNMLIYSAVVEAKCNAPLQPCTHAPLMAYINPHVISRSLWAPA